MGPLILRMRGKSSRASSTPYRNERNATASSTLRGEGFRRLDELNSTGSCIGKEAAADVHAFAQESQILRSDGHEMGGITVTKTMDQDSVRKDHFKFWAKNDTVLLIVRRALCSWYRSGSSGLFSGW